MSRRIEYLDGLRGIAISMVVLFHATHLFTESNSLIARYGQMGVQLFFIISGFVILMTLEKCRTFGEFMVRRWLRLWPAMLIACAFYFSLWPLLPHDPVASILPGLTLIDDRWYSWLVNGPVHPIEGAYWSLYLEMRFYVLFGVCYFAFGERTAIMALVALGVAYLVLLELGFGMGVMRWTDLRMEPWFAAGALFYLWTKGHRQTTFLLASGAGLLAAWVYYPSPGPRLCGAALVALFAIAVRARDMQSILSNRILTWIGAISYPLYLIHGHTLQAFGWAGIPLSLLLAHLIARHIEPVVRLALKQFAAGDLFAFLKGR